LRRRLSVALLVVLLLAVVPVAAGAMRPGTWNAVTSADGANIDQVGLARTPDGKLHVVWKRKTPGHDVNADLVQTLIDANGKVGAPRAIASDWVGVGSPAVARARDGSLLIVAGATSSPDPGAITDFGAWRSTDGGATWAQLPGDAATGGGFADTPGLAFGSDGLTPFFGWGTTFGLLVHRGFAATPATGNFQTAAGFGCCGYDPGIVLDGAGGQLVVGWYSNATNHEGVFAQAVDQATGNPVGAPQRMPGTVTRYAGSDNSSASLARTPVVSRPGRAGVYLAYAGGYPTTTKVLVWRFGARASSVLGRRAGGVSNVTLASDPAGRLWVVWSGGTHVYARRSNPQLSSWGAVVSVPARKGTGTIFKLAANAQAGVLDVLGAFEGGGPGVQTWATQLRPGLTLTAAPARLAVGGRGKQAVTLKATDAGVPVAGAKVTLAGVSATTGRGGTATLAVGPFAHRATLAARATKDGYVFATAKVRVRP
jgi:hypothetical protein